MHVFRTCAHAFSANYQCDITVPTQVLKGLFFSIHKVLFLDISDQRSYNCLILQFTEVSNILENVSFKDILQNCLEFLKTFCGGSFSRLIQKFKVVLIRFLLEFGEWVLMFV